MKCQTIRTAMAFIVCLVMVGCGNHKPYNPLGDFRVAIMRISGKRLAEYIGKTHPNARVVVLLAPKDTACRQESLAVLEGLRKNSAGKLHIVKEIDFPSLLIAAEKKAIPILISNNPRITLFADLTRVEKAFSADLLDDILADSQGADVLVSTIGLPDLSETLPILQKHAGNLKIAAIMDNGDRFLFTTYILGRQKTLIATIGRNPNPKFHSGGRSAIWKQNGTNR